MPLQPSALSQLLRINSEPEAVEDSVRYLAGKLSPILRPGENVMVCFPRSGPASLGTMLEQAVIACGERCVFWEEDVRWITLLRIAFTSRVSTIIGPPLVVLGLAKLAKAQGIPLNVYNAVLAGYPTLPWMIEGIERELDCRAWGIFGPGTEALVSGFSCGCGTGIHIRSDRFGVDLLDEAQNPVEPGKCGMLSVYQKDRPGIRVPFLAYAREQTTPCACGDPSMKLVDITLSVREDMGSPFQIAEQILLWESVLEVSVKRTEYGLELIVIVFPGKKLPKFPTVARQIVRCWDPEKDTPLSIYENWGHTDFSSESH